MRVHRVLTGGDHRVLQKKPLPPWMNLRPCLALLGADKTLVKAVGHFPVMKMVRILPEPNGGELANLTIPGCLKTSCQTRLQVLFTCPFLALYLDKKCRAANSQTWNFTFRCARMNKILSLGDCNTLGVGDCRGNAYPEQFARAMGAEICNCGFTMSTIREAKYFFRDYYDESTKIVTLQLGLVDSWDTFVYAPYVLYYPDNMLRKIARKVVKKYKKIARNLGLNDMIGKTPVVGPERFARGVAAIISACRPDTRILLVEAVPSQDESRNQAIKKYNELLKAAAASDSRCFLIELYGHFSRNMDTLYADAVHINAKGHEFVAHKLVQLNQT